MTNKTKYEIECVSHHDSKMIGDRELEHVAGGFYNNGYKSLTVGETLFIELKMSFGEYNTSNSGIIPPAYFKAEVEVLGLNPHYTEYRRENHYDCKILRLSEPDVYGLIGQPVIISWSAKQSSSYHQF